MTTAVQTTSIQVGDLTLTADVADPDGGPLALLLHGFPQTRHSWRAALRARGERAALLLEHLHRHGVRDEANLNTIEESPR